MLRSLLALVLLLASLPHVAASDFQSNGVKLYYTEAGNPKGEPVILVHGYVITSTLQWTIPGVTKPLLKDYRLILFDNRGHGLSDRPTDPEKYGLEMVHDVARLMDHLHIKQAHIVGYSLGAFIAHKFAAIYPDRTKSIVLGGAGWLQVGPATETSDAIADSLLKKNSLEPLFRGLHPPDAPPLEAKDIDRVNKLALLINNPKALAAVAKGMKHFVLTPEEVKKIKAPTLCIVGERDPLIQSAKNLEGERPGLQMLYVPGANHMNCFELPIFRERIAEFLANQK
jgi:pimeloyl-ACP methyl ester carboxylesterase